ncbi:CTP synthase N-terminus [Lutibacter flavus]|uniref:CTP synthase N-terminus n=1 Tax=Lutibacter flavus TaxID=691689 RepID=A0A238VBS1_9FLAO|nr:CTP synthase N-terminus [Lutibacter flavus]
MKNTKYVFVTGGVTSSLGKGIIAASKCKKGTVYVFYTRWF